MRTCSIHFTTVSTNATPENMKYHVCQSDRVCQMSLRFFEIRFFFSLDAQSVSRCDADFFLSVCSVCLGQTSRNFIGTAPSFLVNMSHSYQLRRLSANSLLPHIFALSFRLNCRWIYRNGQTNEWTRMSNAWWFKRITITNLADWRTHKCHGQTFQTDWLMSTKNTRTPTVWVQSNATQVNFY